MQDISAIIADDFKELLHQKIAIHLSAEQQLPAEVIEVTEFAKFARIEKTPFSVVLRTEQKNSYFPQGIYIINHPTKGNLPLFIVPIGLDTEGMKYEIAFS